MQVPRADFSEESAQRVLPNSEWANQEPTTLDRQIYDSPLLDLRLGRDGPWNPQPETVAPLLNLGLHIDLLPDIQ
jgi:hypothetical protein